MLESVPPVFLRKPLPLVRMYDVDGDEVFVQSRNGKPLGRYFPELETALAKALPGPMIFTTGAMLAVP